MMNQRRINMSSRASLNIPNSIRRKYVSFPNLSSTLVEELKSGNTDTNTNISIIEKQFSTSIDQDNSVALEKMYAILESVSDRVEMHNNIGEQRDRWNTLFFTSINTITLTATTLLSIASNSNSTSSSSSSCLNLSSTLLFLAATGMLTIVNKIQPSQLVEEQRNAARLFKQLHNHIQTIIKMGNPTSLDVMESMDKVLALDKAYPLPLLGSMLDKFPSTVEPAVWWPTPSNNNNNKKKKDIWNGWNGKLEEEMRRIVEVIKKKDKSEYLRLGEKALKLNKMLALTGPLLTGLAAVGSAYASSSTSSSSSWGGMVGMVAGVLASVVNTIEHGGQVGMVFEMYRNNAGFFKLMEETIESNLSEREVEKRENGELFEMKMALQLGRSLSELRELGSSTSLQEDEFASKLF